MTFVVSDAILKAIGMVGPVPDNLVVNESLLSERREFYRKLDKIATAKFFAQYVDEQELSRWQLSFNQSSERIMAAGK